MNDASTGILEDMQISLLVLPFSEQPMDETLLNMQIQLWIYHHYANKWINRPAYMGCLCTQK